MGLLSRLRTRIGSLCANGGRRKAGGATTNRRTAGGTRARGATCTGVGTCGRPRTDRGTCADTNLSTRDTNRGAHTATGSLTSARAGSNTRPSGTTAPSQSSVVTESWWSLGSTRGVGQGLDR
jgi:hypothetical protein